MRTLCLAVMACAIGLAGETALAQDRDGLVVRTESGPVRGVHNGAVDAFLGIPYGAPPVGDKRWRPPQPAQSWNDTREAKAFGAYCAATKSPNGPRSEAEDCLFINVWRPSDVSADAKLPVYVFIYGGGFISGSSNQADMTAIVEKTGVVGVSFNYRLGALGFFSHPDVVKDSGDFGLMDQQAALRWVHENIAVFGGDPTWVTIGGEFRRRLFGLRASDCARFGRPLRSSDYAKRFVCQHSSGSSAKKRPRDLRRGRVRGAGLGRVFALRSGWQAHRRAVSAIWRQRRVSHRWNQSPAGCASESGRRRILLACGDRDRLEPR